MLHATPSSQDIKYTAHLIDALCGLPRRVLDILLNLK